MSKVDEDTLAIAEASYSVWYAAQEAKYALFDDEPADRSFEEDWYAPQQDAHCWTYNFATGLYDGDMPF